MVSEEFSAANIASSEHGIPGKRDRQGFNQAPIGIPCHVNAFLFLLVPGVAHAVPWRSHRSDGYFMGTVETEVFLARPGQTTANPLLPNCFNQNMQQSDKRCRAGICSPDSSTTANIRALLMQAAGPSDSHTGSPLRRYCGSIRNRNENRPSALPLSHGQYAATEIR